MQCSIAPDLRQDIHKQLLGLFATQTAPFIQVRPGLNRWGVLGRGTKP